MIGAVVRHRDPLGSVGAVTELGPGSRVARPVSLWIQSRGKTRVAGNCATGAVHGRVLCCG